MQTTIIGKGRIGSALASIDTNTILLGRKGEITNEPGPIIVCTRNDDLHSVLTRIPVSRRQDLIFVQNGMLQSWLQEHELGNCTQALLYFAVSKKGDRPVDGGGSVVKGRFASAFVDLLAKGGLDCTEVDEVSYSKQMAEKFLWNCVFGALSQYFSCSVGELCRHYTQETTALIEELQQIVETELNISLDEGLAHRLMAYSLSISKYQGSVKEWKWRNGWLWERRKSPLHEKYLRDVLSTILK